MGALLVALTMGGSACASRPSPHSVEPYQLEVHRAAYGRVGVSYFAPAGELSLVEPAKGWWGGLKRGIVVGATLPIAIGLVSPIPGGTFLGVLVAPYTAGLGAIYGVVAAPSTEEVEEAEAGIAQGIARLGGQSYREFAIASFAEQASSLSSFETRALPDLPANEAGDPALDDAQLEGLDTLILLGPALTGLAGGRALDPPLTMFLEVRVRVFDLAEGVAFYDYDVRCTDEERSYADWGADEGRAFSGAVQNCLPRLVEKMLDDLVFLHRSPDQGHE